MKNFFRLALALIGVMALLYTGISGIEHDHSYGLFLTFVGGLTTIGLGLDVVNHLKIRTRKESIRKLGRL